MKLFLKIALGVATGGALLIAGCAVMVGGAANEVSKDMKKDQAANAISYKQFRTAKIGSSEKALIAKYGKPESRQEARQADIESGEDTSTCVYYNRQGGSFPDSYQFCFDNDKLTSKNSF